MEIRVPFDQTQQALSSLCPRETDGWGLPPPTRIEQHQASTFPLERRSRWAEPGLKGETERRGDSSPCSSSRLGIWESPHLSLDLGESPHPVS